MVAPADFDGRLVADCLSGFVDAPLAGIDHPGEDQRLRLGTALGQPAIDEQLIGAPLGRRG
jgi:hypothetical protein